MNKDLKISEETKTILWNMFNDKTCALSDRMQELEAKHAYSLANKKRDIIDELDEVARYLGIID